MPKKETLREERTTNNGVLATVSGKRIGIFSNGRIFPDALHVANVPTAFLAAIVLGLLNMSVKPILLVLSLPITVVTLGIFYLINQRTDVGTDFCRDGRPVPIFKFYVSVYDCNRFEHRKLIITIIYHKKS